MNQRRPIAVLYVLLCASLLTSRAEAQPLKSHADLDWKAPRRWVHIDNIDPQKVQLFESSRKWWLGALHRDSTILGDGRPLFWCGRSGGGFTYFTLYPFRTWTDLDARGDMAVNTNKLVGDSAIKKYDLGDDALIPPHGSEIWRRSAESDIVWPGVDSLTDLTAMVGRMERRQVDWYHSAEFDTIWTNLKTILVKHKYPLACRVYTNSYGGSQLDCILLWLAPDSNSYHNASTLASVLTQELGEAKAKEMLAALDRYFPLAKSYEMHKRLDLSNLGK
jgi:hypothetical protein